MGLSDGERYEKIAHIISALYEINRFNYHDKINKILDGLWFDFLGKSSNGSHWILGSDSSADHLGEFSLLRVEFAAAMPKKEREPEKHTPWQWASEYKPDVECLLESGSEEARIWHIVRLIESYFYAANRYEDKFSDEMANLTRSISTLRGLCFGIMKNDWRFAVAWMMQSLMDKIFPYNNDDLLTICGNQFNWQHDLRVDIQDAKEIRKTFKRYQFGEFATHDKLCTVLRWMGRRFHYDHQHKELLAISKDWNVKCQLFIDLKGQDLAQEEIAQELIENQDDFKRLGWVDVKEIAEICAKNKLAHEDYEKESRNTYAPYCYLTHQSKDQTGYDDQDEE